MLPMATESRCACHILRENREFDQLRHLNLTDVFLEKVVYFFLSFFFFLNQQLRELQNFYIEKFKEECSSLDARVKL